MPTRWQTATVVDIRPETHRAKTFRLRPEAPAPHLAGQHYVVRLTAPDGYTASRSYSVASAPEDTGEIELTVERLENGEVSTFLHDVAEVGDELEVRGPIGGFFVWDGHTPAVLVGGGSGVVPLMSMLRLARRQGPNHPLRLVVSVRSPEELLYAGELPGPDVTVVYTRRAPAGAGRAGLRLRVQRVRRRRHRPPAGGGHARRRHPGRTLRPEFPAQRAARAQRRTGLNHGSVTTTPAALSRSAAVNVAPLP